MRGREWRWGRWRETGWDRGTRGSELERLGAALKWKVRRGRGYLGRQSLRGPSEQAVEVRRRARWWEGRRSRTPRAGVGGIAHAGGEVPRASVCVGESDGELAAGLLKEGGARTSFRACLELSA